MMNDKREERPQANAITEAVRRLVERNDRRLEEWLESRRRIEGESDSEASGPAICDPPSR